MAPGVEISAVREEEFEALLPLTSAYQRFYEVDEVDLDRNRSFFRRFLAPSEVGLLLAARDEAAEVVLSYVDTTAPNTTASPLVTPNNDNTIGTADSPQAMATVRYLPNRSAIGPVTNCIVPWVRA